MSTEKTLLPRFSHKETRKLAQEAVDSGFVYVGDDSKGHAQLYHAETGHNISLPCASPTNSASLRRTSGRPSMAAGSSPTGLGSASSANSVTSTPGSKLDDQPKM